MENKRKLVFTVTVAVVITASLTFAATVGLIERLGTNSKLAAVTSVLDKYFLEDYDKLKLDEAAVAAGVASLGDPYTEYMSKKDWTDFQEQLSAKYCGIGIMVTKESEESYLLVVQVFDNSPAKSAGIEMGDKIVTVDGIDTLTETSSETVSRIKGEEGTSVKLEVQKHDSDTKQEYELVRSMVEIETVSSEIKEDNIGYIRLSSFNEDCGKKFEQHYKQLLDKGASSLIIDLRSNGGGLTFEAEYIANLFLKKGSVVYTTYDKNGKSNEVKTKSDGNTELPMLVLVDGNTASASEILSAALKEHGRAKLVGTKTFGKGLVQTIFNLNDGSALKVTIEKYVTPNGNDINKKGIEPDYIAELKSANDEQLLFAIDMLKK